jgi:hypothetical protein
MLSCNERPFVARDFILSTSDVPLLPDNPTAGLVVILFLCPPRNIFILYLVVVCQN